MHVQSTREPEESLEVEDTGGQGTEQIGCQNRSADQVVRAAVPQHTGLNERRCCCHHCRGLAHHHAGPRGSATKHRAPVPHRVTEPEEGMLVAEVVEEGHEPAHHVPRQLLTAERPCTCSRLASLKRA